MAGVGFHGRTANARNRGKILCCFCVEVNRPRKQAGNDGYNVFTDGRRQASIARAWVLYPAVTRYGSKLLSDLTSFDSGPGTAMDRTEDFRPPPTNFVLPDLRKGIDLQHTYWRRRLVRTGVTLTGRDNSTLTIVTALERKSVGALSNRGPILRTIPGYEYL